MDFWNSQKIGVPKHRVVNIGVNLQNKTPNQVPFATTTIS